MSIYIMQAALDYWTNRNLFSNHYLDEHLPNTTAWESISENTLRDVFDDLKSLIDNERDLVEEYNEAVLEDNFIKPIFDKLGITFEVQVPVTRGQRRPDYAFFENDDVRRTAFKQKQEGGDFYRNVIAVADAKRWDRPLDTRGERQHDFENPSYQIHVYLQETSTDWAVLTNGRHWRLYYGPTSHRLDSYYEVDLPTILKRDNLEAFKYFYLFFRREAFVEDASGECFLDEVYDESNVFAQELGEDLQDNIYEAIKILSEGFFAYSDNDLDTSKLDLVHDSSLIYLYRLIFVLYAESEGRDLLPTDNHTYDEKYSLNELKQTVADRLDSTSQGYYNWETRVWDQLNSLFRLIDQGSQSRDIPEEELYIPAYDGGLFRMDSEDEGSRETRFLQQNKVGDAHLARVIDLLTRSRTRNGSEGKTFVDYSSLDERHLGSIYEGLLEYQLHIADEPLAIEGEEYTPADPQEEADIEPGEVYLTTNSGERKATGSYYTPEYVVEYIVENTLGPLVREIREDLLAGDPFDATGGGGGFAAEFADRVFDLKVLDPAMGSGHFLVNAIDYLAREIVDAQERQAEQQGIETVAAGRDINWARRQVAQRCIYGVDVNPLATELAKVSLWLRTLAAKQPLAFLDHHLKTGNSLVGSDIEEIDALEAEPGADNGPNATLADFGAVRRGTIDHLMDIYQEFIAIENRELADAKEIERRYQEIERDELRGRLVAIANVYTAEDFELEVPEDGYERLARGLSDDEEWAEIEGTAWYRDAQRYASASRYFHWRLEFPEAFYEVHGSEQKNPGFDAVIGNPPYVSNWELSSTNRDLVLALDKSYSEIAAGHWDLYVPFCYRGLSLAKDRVGRHSFIVPSSLATEKYGRKLREYLIEQCDIASLTRFQEHRVFEDVDRQYLIYVASPGIPDHTSTDIVKFDQGQFIHASSVDQSQFLNYTYNAFRTDLVESDLRIASKINSDSVELGRLCCVNPGVVAHSAEDSPEKFTKDDVISDKDGDGKRKYLSSSDIRRYEAVWQGLYIDYEEKKEYFHRPKFPELFESPKIMFSDVSGSNNLLHSCYDDQGYYTNHSVVHSTPWTPTIKQKKSPADYEPLDGVDEYDLRYVTAVVNSQLGNYYFDRFLATGTLQGSYSRVHPNDIRALPVRKVDPDKSLEEWLPDDMLDGSGFALNYPETESSVEVPTEAIELSNSAHDVLAELAQEIIDSKNQYNSLNLDLLDYLGTYTDGQALADLYQPPAGLADSTLTATAAEYEKLRLGRVTVEERSGKLALSATARYKPDEPDAFETDRWGYTETEPEPAMEFVGFSEAETALLREFVPYVVDEAGGFAGFRENATKTKSILDRLEALTLPAIDDVEGGLNRYLRTKERAEELDEKIEKTDELIDQIVYRLYGLTDEEIEVVEESVGK